MFIVTYKHTRETKKCNGQFTHDVFGGKIPLLLSTYIILLQSVLRQYNHLHFLQHPWCHLL